MRNIHARYGYNHETTASDSSDMNGIIDRQYQTLKKPRDAFYTPASIRCFGGDTPIHVVWLYNKSYHKATGMIPFQAWTGQTPILLHGEHGLQ
jgi:hypothetical protein